MEFQIPLDTLFTQVFGIAAGNIRRYNVNSKEEKQGELSRPYTLDMEERDDSQNLLSSSVGNPVMFPMGFTESQEYLIRTNGSIKKVTRKGMWLPFTSVASFSRAKRFKETYMSGQEGSVIEEFGFEPWNIRIQGFILKDDKVLTTGKSTVEEQTKELKSYEELSDAIGVKGDMFEWLGIHKVAIINLSFPEARNLNMEYVKPFELSLRSIQPLELILL